MKKQTDEFEQRKQRWRRIGEYYGYPACCIDSFCNDPFKKSLEQMQVGQHGLGFIPCHAHAVAVVKGEIRLQELIKDRKCPTPFPVCNPQEDIKNIFHK